MAYHGEGEQMGVGNRSHVCFQCFTKHHLIPQAETISHRMGFTAGASEEKVKRRLETIKPIVERGNSVQIGAVTAESAII